jgi:hypothetical protein
MGWSCVPARGARVSRSPAHRGCGGVPRVAPGRDQSLRRWARRSVLPALRAVRSASRLLPAACTRSRAHSARCRASRQHLPLLRCAHGRCHATASARSTTTTRELASRAYWAASSARRWWCRPGTIPCCRPGSPRQRGRRFRPPSPFDGPSAAAIVHSRRTSIWAKRATRDSKRSCTLGSLANDDNLSSSRLAHPTRPGWRAWRSTPSILR